MTPAMIGSSDEEEETLPVTSHLCKWNVPRKRKESMIPMSEAVFQKHDYSKPMKQSFKLLEDFDPRPVECRGTASSQLPDLLEKIGGQQLCISLLFDKKCQHWDEESTLLRPSEYSIPKLSALKETIAEFKESLQLNDDEIREIEQNTREQRLCPLWYSARRYRITASMFGAILSRRADTAPDKLVLRLLQADTQLLSTPAMEYGIKEEPIAIEQYVAYQNTHGQQGLTVSSSGFLISLSHPFLGASPDGAVYDPTDHQHPFGFLEVKCPYRAREVSPMEACKIPGYFCTTDPTANSVKLKDSHAYYSQVQGQMAIGGRPWCDFVTYTGKGISVERIIFNELFWKERLLPS